MDATLNKKNNTFYVDFLTIHRNLVNSIPTILWQFFFTADISSDKIFKKNFSCVPYFMK